MCASVSIDWFNCHEVILYKTSPLKEENASAIDVYAVSTRGDHSSTAVPRTLRERTSERESIRYGERDNEKFVIVHCSMNKMMKNE